MHSGGWGLGDVMQPHSRPCTLCVTVQGWHGIATAPLLAFGMSIWHTCALWHTCGDALTCWALTVCMRLLLRAAAATNHRVLLLQGLHVWHQGGFWLQVRIRRSCCCCCCLLTQSWWLSNDDLELQLSRGGVRPGRFNRISALPNTIHIPCCSMCAALEATRMRRHASRSHPPCLPPCRQGRRL